mmetsp:Transcript_9589/g.16113  ORF Transcript_9589/g.16113 Transcript_9589/m.16113 type:complete len:108 (+) Transcript_9589:176-499(+)
MLKEFLAHDFDQLEIFEGFDLNDASKIRESVRGCSLVIHVATPLPRPETKKSGKIESQSEQSIKVLLEACEEAGVQKLILTISTGSVIGTGFKESGATYTHDDFALE